MYITIFPLVFSSMSLNVFFGKLNENFLSNFFLNFLDELFIVIYNNNKSFFW